MRTFICSIHDRRYDQPGQAIILAADEQRARLLAERELANWAEAVKIEMRENGRTLWAHAA